MRATAAPEEGNKVRLSVEIDEAEIDIALDGVMNRLSREVRVPGFRPGKVPRRVIEARMGGAAALRSSVAGPTGGLSPSATPATRSCAGAAGRWLEFQRCYWSALFA